MFVRVMGPPVTHHDTKRAMMVERAPGARHWWAPPAEVTPHQGRLLAVLGTTYILNQYDYGILTLALPQIQASLGVPEDRLAGLTAVIRLGVVPAMLLTVLADSVGRRRLLLVTILGITLCTFATAFVRTQTEFAAVQFLARMFIYAEEIMAIVVLTEELHARTRGWGIGVLAALGALGHGLASLLFASVDRLPHGWRTLYVLGVVPLLLVAWYRRTIGETRRFTESRARRAAALDLASLIRPVRALLTAYPGRLLALCAAVFPFVFMMATAATLQSKYLQQAHGYTPGNVAMLYIGGGALAILGNVAAGAFSDRYGRRRTLMAGLVVNSVGVAGFYGTTGVWVPLAWVLMIFSYFGMDVLFAALGSELFPTSYRSTASGVRSLMVAIAGALGLWAEGWLYGSAGSHASAILRMIPVAWISFFVILAALPETATRELEEIAPEPVAP
jgi:putative MFS transporter